MKTTISQVREMSDSIFIKEVFQDEEFVLLRDQFGNTFDTLHDAIDFVRESEMSNVGLATFRQAILNNSEWDNL
jgi:hypothetical protein